MKKENTIRENVEWLLEQYKKDLEHLKNNNVKDCEVGYSVEQAIWDDENIIIELETILKLSKED